MTLDLGGIYGGYCSDNRRYAYTGEPPEALMARLTRWCRSWTPWEHCSVPGTTHAELYKTTLELYEQSGVKPLARFSHVGHNIGLETEERWLADSDNDVISAGMAINIELYTHAESGEQIGDEETYIVSVDGPERVSSLPRQIRKAG